MRFVAIGAACALLSTHVLSDTVEYTVNGESFAGYYASADDAKGLVLVIHDWDGLDEYEERRAEMLAELGYDAFALDMFGTATPTETVEHRRAAMGELYGNRDRMRNLVEAGLQQARELSDATSLVAMGYCFGGAVTLEMARSGTPDEAVGYATFHGGLTTPEGQEWPAEVAPLLIMHGGADSSVTMEDVATLVEELEAAEATYTVEIYSGAPHAFTVFGTDGYQERADRESWEAFTDFLAERLRG